MDSSSLASITCNGNQTSVRVGAGDDSIVKPLRCRTTQSALSSSSSFRSLSFSSSTLYTENSSPLSLISSPQFNGIPFSWEQSPGIPKDYSHSSYSKLDPSVVSSLPLPPLTATNNNNPAFDIDARKQTMSHDRSKSSTSTSDPFVAALMKCTTTDHRYRNHHVITEDNHRKSRVISRTLSDRFGFVDLSTSCIRSCDVLESNVLVPKSTRMLNGSRSS